MRLLLGASILLACAASTARADDLHYQLETSMATSYVYRGIVQYSSHDVPSSQNTAAVTVDHVAGGALTFTAWNATAMSHYDSQPGTSLELDLAAAYAIHRGATAITAGYTAFLYPNHAADQPFDAAHEFSLVVAHELPYVTPFVGAYLEPVRQQGAYVALGASQDYKTGRLTLTPSASIGFAGYRHYLGSDVSASPNVNDVTVSCAGKVDLGEGIYALARLSYAARLTPSDLAPMMDWSLDSRQTMFGVLSLGVAR